MLCSCLQLVMQLPLCPVMGLLLIMQLRTADVEVGIQTSMRWEGGVWVLKWLFDCQCQVWCRGLGLVTLDMHAVETIVLCV